MGQSDSIASKDGLRLKLWRGQRMCLLGMDLEAPEDDFVGFAIEVRSPGGRDFSPLRNRLAFAYPQADAGDAVTGARQFSSLEAPFQKFRWLHFPFEPKLGNYTYRVTKMHMPSDGKVVAGTQVQTAISLDPVLYRDFLDVGFTRNFASSQAYAERFKNNPTIIPGDAKDGLTFDKTKSPAGVYEWLGFEAYRLIFDFLNEALHDPAVTLDVLAYDFNEPDILAVLKQMGGRLRIVMDDSKDHVAGSAEDGAAAILKQAGAAVRRTHFQNLQHNKVLIARKDGKPVRALFGSTNFSFRGLYIQANNALRFDAPDAAAFFAQMFEQAFNDPGKFGAAPLAKQWQLVSVADQPPTHLCFSPHKDAHLSLNPVGGAIDQATSSVFFSIAFLNLIQSGPTHDAIARLAEKTVFSYGISDLDTGLNVHKPDGSVGVVDFAYLGKTAPPPFGAEWSGGKGIHLHHKFVVADFNLPTAKVFTGSSNLAVSGEEQNGDNLVMIEDQRIATAYAIEALRMFDHLHFRTMMQDKAPTKAKTAKASIAKAGKPSSHAALTLRKPEAIGGQPAWFADYYKPGTQAANDRTLFSN